MAVDFFIRVEDASGNILGSGPILSAQSWETTRRIDAAGEFSFTMPAGDLQSSLLTEKRRVRAYALIDSVWTEIGDGIIDKIDTQIGNDGVTLLQVSGPDGLAELAGYTADYIPLSPAGAAASPLYAVAILDGIVDLYVGSPSWTFVPLDVWPAGVELYGELHGDSVLHGLAMVAEKVRGAHFRYNGSRTLTWFEFGDYQTGIRAIRTTGDLSAKTCAITDIRRTVESHEILTRIRPLGAGNAEARLTMAATTRSAPTGYTLNASANRLINNDAETLYGVIDRFVEFKDISPVSNTDADIEAAADALFDSALIYLQRYSTRATHYDLSVAGCSQLLQPGDTILVDYRDPVAGININATLNILESTISIDASGLRTNRLLVSDSDRMPTDDLGVLVSRITEAKIFQAYPQLNANSYTVGYTKNVDADETAIFRFRFGAETVQINQVLFEFQLLPFESTIKSIASDVPSSSSGGGSVGSSASGGSHTHTVTITGHSHTVTIAGHSHTVTIAAHSHTVTVTGHSHTVTIAAHSHTVTIAGHSHTVTIAAHTHTATTIAHTHNVQLQGDPNPTGNHGFARIVYYDVTDNELYFEAASGGASSKTSQSSSAGTASSSTLAQTTPTSNTTADTAPTSSTLAQTTPTSNTTADTTPTSSTLAQTTPTSNTTAQTTPTSSTTADTTPTSASSGTHTHTVTIPAHTHTVAPVITTVYGIFRDDVANTFVIGNLRYRVNSGSWAALSVATDVGGGWYQLDLTSQIYNATTYRPLAEYNELEIGMNTANDATITEITGTGPNLVIQTSPAPSTDLIGKEIQVSGTTNYNGTYTVYDVSGGYIIILGSYSGPTETTGSVKYLYKRVTIDGLLSVRNIIQAVGLV